VKKIEDAFKEFTNRDDIAIVLISQYIANMIRHLLSVYSKVSSIVYLLICMGASVHLQAVLSAHVVSAPNLPEEMRVDVLACSLCRPSWKFPAKNIPTIQTRTPSCLE
jgi:hypothetical protein